MKKAAWRFLVRDVDGVMSVAEGTLAKEPAEALDMLHVELQNRHGEEWLDDGRGGKKRLRRVVSRLDRSDYRVLGGFCLGKVYDEFGVLKTPDAAGRRPKELVVLRRVQAGELEDWMRRCVEGDRSDLSDRSDRAAGA